MTDILKEKGNINCFPIRKHLKGYRYWASFSCAHAVDTFVCFQNIMHKLIFSHFFPFSLKVYFLISIFFFFFKWKMDFVDTFYQLKFIQMVDRGELFLPLLEGCVDGATVAQRK